jgi:hypothetical protein
VDHEKAPWAPRRSEMEQKRMDCRLLYDLEIEFRKVGWGDPALVYDEEKDLFRFTDGGLFAFSREHADRKLLRKRGRLSGPLSEIVARDRSRR